MNTKDVSPITPKEAVIVVGKSILAKPFQAIGVHAFDRVRRYNKDLPYHMRLDTISEGIQEGLLQIFAPMSSRPSLDEGYYTSTTPTYYPNEGEVILRGGIDLVGIGVVGLAAAVGLATGNPIIPVVAYLGRQTISSLAADVMTGVHYFIGK